MELIPTEWLCSAGGAASLQYTTTEESEFTPQHRFSTSISAPPLGAAGLGGAGAAAGSGPQPPPLGAAGFGGLDMA